MRFKNQVAIITGAASGMGLLTAQKLAEEGAKVVLTDVNAEALAAATEDINKNGGEAIGVQVDVRNYEQVQNAADTALKKYGTVDFLLNFAGGAEGRVLHCPAPFHEMPIEVIDWGLDVNLKGAVYFCRAVLGIMFKQKNGVIINLGSVTGVEGGGPGAVNYSAAKSGIIGLTKSLALCGAPYGVRACCVSPGPVLTRPDMANMPTRLGRAAEPQEVIDLILYLCSDKAAFITGTNYLIDGGRSCGGISRPNNVADSDKR
ncbi:MAG: SDR family NAD(P)-dependent oxidoreductase [Victivallales bacterium]|nr:SDR family NAD(P)-dependent oxidoreductase [Victivallales bacterium]